MTKKVLHVITSLELGGAETALYRLLMAMQNQPYEFFVLVLKDEGHYSAQINAMGIPIHYLHLTKTNVLSAFLHGLAHIKRLKPDVVQTWMYHADLFGGLAAKIAGVKNIIWGVRCEGVGLKPATRMIQKFCAALSWMIPNIVMMNSNIAVTNHRRLGYQFKKMRVIHNGFDMSALSSQNTAPTLDNTLPPNAFLIGTLARFHQDKGYETLIASIDKVCERHQNIYFVFCGQGCSQQNLILQKQLHQLKHQDKVILINGVADTIGYLNKLNLFVLPSRTEAFPNCLAEAMLCELPCVATDVGEVQHILGEVGLVVPKENPEALTDALLTMVEKSPEERMRLGCIGKNRVESKFSMDKNMKMVSSLYEIGSTACVE
jgi:glycosyltransferase involved in cell wall biosynthesis